ncbi:HD domain-containing protein [Halalkalibacter urbisdiaboli]|uniref:HD domain-containing protein n=1 Tax=Halalkalibacter urbisdiaboli TaxID=1960589 RepID=UPI000B44C44E|nr:HD domain-containing protein [Halalkalibacter urbisdiaboli]
MNQKGIIEATEKWVKDQLEHESSGHDWYHIARVTKQAREIAQIEGADLFIVTLAALLHDLADDKVVENEQEGLQRISDWLKSHQVDDRLINHILMIIQTMSYKGGTNTPVETLEGQVVQDADRLDSLGAIGIARTFVYSGSKGQPMYNPSLPVREKMTLAEYRKGESSAIHHFYEKLLKLKDLMNTETAKARAAERHAFMESFLEQFYNEWG